MPGSIPPRDKKRVDFCLLKRSLHFSVLLRRSGILMACTFALALLNNAAPQSRSADKSASASATQSAPPVRSDESLQREIERKFAASKIGENHFQVFVRNGIATLSGTARVAQHKGVATRLARGAGAREVVNRIEISPGAKARLTRNLNSGGGTRESSAAMPSRNGDDAVGSGNDAATHDVAAERPSGAEANSLQKNKNTPANHFNGKRLRVLDAPARGQKRSEPKRRY